MSNEQFKDYEKLLKAYTKYVSEFVEYFNKYPQPASGDAEGPGTLPGGPPPPPPPPGA